MPLNVRIAVVGAVIIFSAGYGSLTSQDPELARTLAVGYIVIVLSIILLLDVWKKDHYTKDDRDDANR